MTAQTRQRPARQAATRALPILLGIVGAVARPYRHLPAHDGLQPQGPGHVGPGCAVRLRSDRRGHWRFRRSEARQPALNAVPPRRYRPCRSSSGSETAGATTRNAFKSLGIVVAVTSLLSSAAGLFMSFKGRRPGSGRQPVRLLQFEVRLPAGAAMPNPRDDVKVNLRETLSTLLDEINTMPADMERATFRQRGRSRGDRRARSHWPFASSDRQVEVTIPRRSEHDLAAQARQSSPRHMKQFTAWEKHSDGSEIRYRVKWPGED